MDNRFTYEKNLVNEARTVATMVDWLNTKNDSSIEKWTKLLRELAGCIDDHCDLFRHYEERIEFLEKKLNESEKARYEKVETVQGC